LGARPLHCFAEGRERDWEAICLDLDIAVQGHSFEAVSDELAQAVSLSLQTIADLPPGERTSLLRRPVPFLVRLSFVARAVRGLVSTNHADRQHHCFTLTAIA
jgi:hypothetical protein